MGDASDPAAPPRGPGGDGFEGGFIEGVSEFCDRWCERCPLAGRCRLRAFERELGDLADPADTDADRRARFRRALKVAYGVDDRGDLRPADAATVRGVGTGDRITAAILELAERDDWDPDPPPPTGGPPHPLATAARALAVDLLRWLREHGEAAEIACDAAVVRDCGTTPADALAEVRWYGVQPAAALARAAAAGAAGDVRGRDGHAKVALLACGRAFGAFTALRDVLPAALPARGPAFAAEIADFQRRLATLRALADRQFPDARPFVRPGLDDGAGENPD